MTNETLPQQCVVIDETSQKAPLQATAKQLRRMLEIIENDILPKTTESVTKDGNKVFGAAILSKDLDVIHADTNTETECPIFHGEVKCIYAWSQKTPASDRGSVAQSSVFLSTHEPCCMCISSILWAGFQTVYYLFPYSITADQGIPHDIQTMHELWGVSTYRKQNKYLSTACIMDLIQALPESEEEGEKQNLIAMQNRLIELYDKVSQTYHTEKSNNKNNSLVLG